MIRCICSYICILLSWYPWYYKNVIEENAISEFWILDNENRNTKYHISVFAEFVSPLTSWSLLRDGRYFDKLFSHSENRSSLFYKANFHCWILPLRRVFGCLEYCQFVQQLPLQFRSIFGLSYVLYIHYHRAIPQVFHEEEVESGYSVSNLLLVRIFDYS